jgi:Fe-S cluster assembly protein SufD
MNITELLNAWLPALGALNPLQQQALDYLHVYGLPSRRVEHWKYTDVSRFLTSHYQLAATQALLPADFIKALNAHKNLQASWQPRQLSAENFRDGIEALHHLLVPQTLHIQISGQQHLQLFPSHDLRQQLFASSITLELAEHAELTLYEADLAIDSFGFSQLHIVMTAHSQCRHAFLGNASDLHISRLQVDQQADSHYQGLSIAVGGKLCRREHQFDLAGHHAKVQLNTLSLNQQQQHHEMRVEANHLAPDTQCDLRHNAVADDEAVSNCNGRIHISKAGHQAQGAFISKSLLLSASAQINTQPELEIYHDQVRCSHGATTSALDDDQRLYLRARGLDEKSANALLLTGFVRNAFDHFADADLSAPLWTQVQTYLRPR